MSNAKFVPEDLSELMNKSQSIQEEQMGNYQVNHKKRKISDSLSVDTPQRVRDTFVQQIESRQQCTVLMLNNLSDNLTELDADYAMMKENKDKLEQLTGAFLKCIQESNAAQKQKLKSLWKIHATFKKGCEELNAIQKEQNQKLTEDVEDDLKNFEQKLVEETKRKGWDNLRKKLFHAMQNDLVEGLIIRGAMEPDDRPLWFDIYKKFPPATEPKFAKPLPEIKPIRPILYEEDIVRAKFHSSGHGYGAVNMLSPTGDTPIKKLVKQYEKLKSEGVPESELVEKASAAFETQRQQDFSAPKTIAKNPDSVTAQVLAEADLKNVFND